MANQVAFTPKITLKLVCVCVCVCVYIYTYTLVTVINIITEQNF